MSTAAIRGWSLLLSTVPTWRMTTSRIEASLQVIYNADAVDIKLWCLKGLCAAQPVEGVCVWKDVYLKRSFHVAVLNDNSC